jgi:translation initiation factor 4A
MTPTHELAKQTSNVLKSLGSLFPNLCVKTLIGGTSIQEDAQSIQQTCPHIVVGCAGRIYDMFRRKYINGKDMKIMVLDEADEMLSSGFKDQIYNIFQYMNENIQVVLFSATLPTEILSLTSKFMREPEKITIDVEKLNLECIKQYYIAMRNDSDKYDTLKDLFSYINVSQCIIYCNSVKRVVDLHRAMVDEGFSVCCIHSSMEKSKRDEAYSEFKAGKHRVLISSDVTSRGIDVQQVSLVINYDLPTNRENYIHRIGRSGRFGRKGVAINFVTGDDVRNMRDIEQFYNTQIEEMPMNVADLI